MSDRRPTSDQFATAPAVEAAAAALGALRARIEASWLLRSAVAAFAGFLASYAQAPASFWPALLICLPALLALFRAASTPRAAALTGWAFGVGYFLPGLLWIGSAFLVEADKFAWMMPFAVTLLPMGLSLFWAAAFAAAAQTRRRFGPGFGVLGLAVLWPLAEWLRGHILTGFPWGLFGFAWIETPVAQWAAWIGPYGLNALTIALGLLIGHALGALLDGDRRAGLQRLGAALAALALLWTAGLARLPADPVARAGPQIRLVQPNVPQTEKWSPPFVRRNFDRLLALSSQPAAAAPELIIWPETATPFMVDRRDDLRPLIMERIRAPRLIVGSQRFEGGDPQTRRWWNSLFVVGAGGRIEAVYDKHHLVPFGEYLPFQDALQSIGIRQLAGRSTGFSTGPGPQTLRLDGLPSFAALICYEAIFPAEMPTGADRPDLLLQITNDAWFGESSGPYQHLVQARMRAIEQGLPFVRSANTGVSAGVDPYGRVERALPLNVQGVVDLRAAAPLSPTLYARYGDAFFWLWTLALLAAGAALSQRESA